MQDLINICTLILTVAAATIAVLQQREASLEKRLERFRLLHKLQTIDSTRIRAHLSGEAGPRGRARARRTPPFRARRLATAATRRFPALLLLTFRLVERRALNEQDERAGLGHANLVTCDAWGPDAASTPVRLTDLRLTAHRDASGPARHLPVLRAFRRSQILPRPRIGLADNLVLFTDAKSFDAPSYGLRALPVMTQSGPELTIGWGQYYDFIDTCMCFGFEAARSVVDPAAPTPLRTLFPFSEVDNRHVQLGIVTLCILRNVVDGDQERDFFLLHRRSAAVAESANLLNAIPGGTFQPQLDLRPEDFDDASLKDALMVTVVREFCEEVLGVEEFAELVPLELVRQRTEWDVFVDNTYFAGMGFNPLNAYFEILSVAELDLAQEQVAAIFGGRTRADVDAAVRPNAEGTVQIRPFDWSSVEVCSNSYRAAPTLKALCALVQRDSSRGSTVASRPWSTRR